MKLTRLVVIIPFLIDGNLLWPDSIVLLVYCFYTLSVNTTKSEKMKKIISAVLLSVAIISVSYAQEKGIKQKDSRNRMHLMIKAGINNSNVYDEDGDRFSAEPKYGFAGGVSVSVPLGKYFGLQPGALISQKGFRATGRLMDESYDLKRTTTFLDVPLLLELKPVRFITIVGGPQYSYLLNQTDVIKSNNNVAVQEEEFKNDNVRKNILSAAIGFDLNFSRWVISGRYNADLQKNNGDRTSETPRYKNIWVQGTIGMRF
jgi:hypothetical protein